MALVQLTDVVIPAIYRSYIAVNSPEKTAFATSGVVVRNAAIDTAFAGGGSIAHLPYWKDLDAATEPNYSTDNPADVAVPDKIQAAEMLTRISEMNKAYSSADLTAEILGQDPMQQIRNRFGTWWNHQFQHRLIAILRGVMAKNIATNSGDMVTNIALETTVGVTAANLWSRGAFTSAIFTAGDAYEQFAAIAVHSVVLKRMIDLDDITVIQPSTPDPNLPLGGGVPTFMGKRVIVDDSMPVIAGTTSGFKYVSAIFGQGAFGFGSRPAQNPFALKREELQGNGGGVEIIVERLSWVLHPFGHSFTSGSVAGQSPTNAELALAANWSRTLERKLVPLAFLITNG